LLLEALEDRRMLAVVNWDGGGDATSWNDPLNWNADALPESADDVIIDVTEAVSVMVAEATTVRSLVNAETVQVGDSAFSVTDSLTNSGSLLFETGSPAAQILFTIGDHFEGLHIQRGRSR